MRICMIAEGCYPYVVGGVSTWIQMLLQRMPQHEFVIVAIGAEKKQRGKFKYDIPPNVVEIQEYFLDEYLITPKKTSKDVRLTPEQQQAVLEFLRGNLRDWSSLFELFQEGSGCQANDFLMSRSFMNIVQTLCDEAYVHTPFKDLFWALRSMLIPALNLLRCPIPEADLYHTVATGYAGMLGAKFQYFTKKPYLVTEHGIYTREREEEILKAEWVSPYFKQTWIAFFRSLSYAAYFQASQIVSLFHGAQALQIELGAPKERCIVIPNGTDIHRFADVPPIPLEPHPLTIGTVTRVVPIKDIKTMVHSFAVVKQRRPDAKLYIIGPYDENPDYYEECRQTIDYLNCPDIFFTGRSRVEEWLPKLDIVILTSISEGQPFVLIEAMASHRPVVATNVGGCRELVEGNGDGFGPAGKIVPVMSPAQIAEGILEVGQSAAHMRELAENGYARAVRFYQDTDFLRRYDELYCRLIREYTEEVKQPWQALASN